MAWSLSCDDLTWLAGYQRCIFPGFTDITEQKAATRFWSTAKIFNMKCAVVIPFLKKSWDSSPSKDENRVFIFLISYGECLKKQQTFLCQCKFQSNFPIKHKDLKLTAISACYPSHMIYASDHKWMCFFFFFSSISSVPQQFPHIR